MLRIQTIFQYEHMKYITDLKWGAAAMHTCNDTTFSSIYNKEKTYQYSKC